MNRLLQELDRLYGEVPKADGEMPAEVGPADRERATRAAVLEVVLPAGWEQLSAVWRGVQSDLALPAPAIAVSGDEGLQLWFSFASPLSPAAMAQFLEGLRRRYLPAVVPRHVRLFTEAAALPAAPCVETGPQRWSAFVTPDLASVFGDTPWLDIPPSDEGQAAILRALEPIRTADFEAALRDLGMIGGIAHPDSVEPKPSGFAMLQNAGVSMASPAQFLTGVMNDPTTPLALRIEAARILMAHAERR